MTLGVDARFEVTTMHIFRSVMPFVSIQLLMLGVLALIPGMTIWLPRIVSVDHTTLQ